MKIVPQYGRQPFKRTVRSNHKSFFKLFFLSAVLVSSMVLLTSCGNGTTQLTTQFTIEAKDNLTFTPKAGEYHFFSAPISEFDVMTGTLIVK